MTCVACSAELPEGAGFCHVCGARQAAAVCTTCGSPLTAGAAFCNTCGTPVAATAAATAGRGAERRLASVMFADLVSYTTLSERRDQEDVRELLTAYFEVCSTVVKRYGGTVEKFIGDAVMAVWGVPTAHEDDAERAVRAATELVASVVELGERLGIPELQLRAGVVTGEVAVTLGATDQGMVAGDPVNTAARVQSAAGAGEVWVDASTRALTSAGVAYLDAGTHLLKGKAEPVQLYCVGTIIAAVGGNQRVDGLEAPLTGRDRELRTVKELFHGTVESGRPRMVILDGEAGIGKTRLAWEFEKYVSGIETDTYWHRGRCLSYGDGVAFWALTEALRARLGLVDDADLAGFDLDERLRQWVPDDAERDWLRPRLATLLGEDGAFPREDLFAAWTRFFERLGDDSEAVTLVIDDAQAADDGLLAFLDHLLANARTAVFVLLLARPELLDEHPQLGGRRSARVPLEPLTDTAMVGLVDGLVDGLPPATRSALVARAEGVPLFAVETVRALIDRDLVRPEGGRYVVADGVAVDLTDIAAPASLHALVAARLDALTPDERRVVADASVLGETFTQQGIASLCRDVIDLPAVLADLQRKDIVGTDHDRFSAERGQYRFVQSVVRQVAYATLSRRDRKQRHLAVADHLEAQVDAQPEVTVLIARHLADAVEASAPDDGDVATLNERAAALLAQSAARSARLGAHLEALRLYEESTERSRDGRAQADALAGASHAAGNIHRYDDAIRLSDRAAQLYLGLGEVVAAAESELRIARAQMVMGYHREGIEVCRRAWERVRDLPGADSVSAQAAMQLARLLSRVSGDFTEQAYLSAEALRRCERSGDPATMIDTFFNFAAMQMQGGGSLLVGRAVSREVITLCRVHGQWGRLVGLTTNLALLERVDNLSAGVASIEEALRIGTEHGIAGGIVWPNLATSLWYAGAWHRHAQLAVEMIEELPELTIGDQIILHAADLWRQQAGLPALIESYEGSSDDDPNWRLWDAHVKALGAAAEGRTGDARDLAVRCVDHALEDAGLTDDFVVATPRLVMAMLVLGDLEVARYVVTQLESGPKGAVLGAYETSFRGLVHLLSGDDVELGEQLTRDGITELAACGAVPDHALTQELLGGWLLDHGRGDEGRALLGEARATLDGLGAVAYVARIDARLGASVSV